MCAQNKWSCYICGVSQHATLCTCSGVLGLLCCWWCWRKNKTAPLHMIKDIICGERVDVYVSYANFSLTDVCLQSCVGGRGGEREILRHLCNKGCIYRCSRFVMLDSMSKLTILWQRCAGFLVLVMVVFEERHGGAH